MGGGTKAEGQVTDPRETCTKYIRMLLLTKKKKKKENLSFLLGGGSEEII